MNKDFLQFNDNKQINLNKYDFDGRSSEQNIEKTSYEINFYNQNA